MEYAITHQSQLVLKPTLQSGGEGVLLGWQADTTPELWREQLASACDGPYVVQRRIRPVPELFPSNHGDLVPWIVTWGVFGVVSGYGGTFARAVPVGSNSAVINLDAGASLGACLHEVAA
jgi:hypothetical protein